MCFLLLRGSSSLGGKDGEGFVMPIFRASVVDFWHGDFFIIAEGQYPDALPCGSSIALFHFNFSKENRVNLDLLLFIKITSRAII